ncbi:hypothetical protein ACXM5X_17120 [Pseudomonas saponiphila]|uniref:Uncharacterized protein n=1 Tax=Pseudomonas saponiphila TaxID=556534 RepID=A0A1H4QJ43_9PSED|nr:hypothetical protein [Pseudomonas saponiphila]SEC19541.1 hypothetical protein SAMN05216178_3791 [Pseudomonas saponiphila]
MSVRQGIGICIHLLFCVIYIFLHDYLVGIYVSIYGGFTSRGIAIAMTSGLMFYLFVLMSFVVFLISGFKWKVLVIFLLMISIFFYFYPRYPVRAIVYSLLEGGLMMLAVLLRMWLEKWLLRVGR